MPEAGIIGSRTWLKKMTHLAMLLKLLCVLSCIDGHAAVKTGATALDDTPLLDQLLEQLGIGKGSCEKVAQLARAALRPATQGLQEVACIQSHNAERDLHRWAGRQAWSKLLPELYEFQLLLNNIEDHGTSPGIANHYALLPHEVFNALHLNAPQLFKELFGTSDQLTEFWQHAQRTGGSWYTSHPIIASEPQASKRVPYALHGDDAGMHGHDQTLCITWGPVAGSRKTTLDTRIAFSMVKCHNILMPATTNDLYSVLRWSLDALGKGDFPDRDHVWDTLQQNTPS